MLAALPSTRVFAYADDVTLTAHGGTEESTTTMLQSLLFSSGQNITVTVSTRRSVFGYLYSLC